MRHLIKSVYTPSVKSASLLSCFCCNSLHSQATHFASSAAAAAATASSSSSESEESSSSEPEKERNAAEMPNALGKANDVAKRNFIVFSNTTKAVYVHPINHISSWFWFTTETHKWFTGAIVIFIGTQMFARYRIAKAQTAAQAQLGENLLDQRTRDLLSDIETLRKKDPLRLEHEANYYHEQFWKRRAKAVSESRNEVRQIEIERGLLQGEARGTDMTEWLGAKAKDEEEREIARRTQDYIQGFHQHLKAKRLI